MTTHTTLVSVYYVPDKTRHHVGRLARVNRQIVFEYDSDFLHTGWQLSPFTLPLKPGVFTADSTVFEGLFGVFNDSLPDGWGQLLLDRRLRRDGILPNTLTPLDRLSLVGTTGMGALQYEPAADQSPIVHPADLDGLAAEIRLVQADEESLALDELWQRNGSSGGARPKILLDLSGEHWLIKFPASADFPDIAEVEYAYHLMAKDAGIDVPDAKLFPSKHKHAYFGVKRFDREGDAAFHMHTLSGLLQVDHRLPTLDYDTVLKATRILTQDIRESEKQFHRVVFNVLSHNRDDHAKNFSFLMAHDGQWQLSPAYDLTFSAGPAGEHCTTVMGEGNAPTMTHLLALAKQAEIKPARAKTIFEDVQSAVAKWRVFAEEAKVSRKTSQMIQERLRVVNTHNKRMRLLLGASKTRLQ